jgi:serine/threonine protein kinase
VAKKIFTSESIPEFKILEKLGQGGMGSVFKAVQKSLDREVALKIMPARLAENPEFKERFFREAKAAGRLNHTNIVQGIDAGESDGFCWIAMELVTGGSVTQLLKKKGTLSKKEALSITLQIARGLDHASKAGIVHRDVKPENFLITEDGVAKLCDLGISKVSTDAGLTQDGNTLGTPHYISPEQARGQSDIDTRADIYSLGASWYHLLSGRTPFEGPTAAVVMTKHITEKAPSITTLVENIDRNTVQVLEKMMAKKRDERYADAEALIADLEALESGITPPGVIPAADKNISQRTRKIRPAAGKAKSVKKAVRKEEGSPALLYGGIGGAVLLFIILIAAFYGRDEPSAVKPQRVPVVRKKPAPVSSRKSNPAPSRAKRKPVKKPVPVQRKRTGSAEKFKRLQGEIASLPDSAKIEYLKQFAGDYRGSKEAGAALQQAKDMEKKIMQYEAQAMERSAMQARSHLPEIRRIGAVEVYEKFVQDYRGSKAAELTQKELDDFVRGGGERGEITFAEIPQDADGAHDVLKMISAGEVDGRADDIVPFVEHRKSSIRKEALRALGNADRGVYVKKSLEALADRNEGVRIAALDILEKFTEEENVREQIEEVSRKDNSPLVRNKAERILYEDR